MTEALQALVDEFAKVPETATSRLLPLATELPGAEDALVALLDDVICALDVLSVVPVRFHLTETESGGIAGDMEVVPVDQVVLIGPAPKAASYHGLSMVSHEGGWRCRVMVDV